MPDPNTNPNAQPFYVGYLPVPLALVRFLRWIVPPLGLLIVAISIALARSQADPGAAVWNDAKPREFQGTLIVDPYPLLVVPGNSAESVPVVYLLVEMGKRGGRSDLRSIAGKSVIVSGWLLERDGRRMIELESEEQAVRVQPQQSTTTVERRDLGQVTLRGEIIDSKCYLGAMKPGEGKTHKACATLCIRGGLPPMLVVISPEGRLDYFLLIDPSGAPLSSDLWPLISEPVQVTGNLESLGDLRILRVAPNQVQPL